MAYLGDIRENSIGLNGEIWEGDNRVEERYYYNGMYIDLCGLPAEEYCKTIFVTNGSSSSDKEESKRNNPITIELVSYVNEEGVEVYAYRAFAKQPVATDVTVTMEIQNEEGEKETVYITVPKNTSSSNVEPTRIPMKSARPPKVTTSDYSPKNDETFDYNTVLPEEKPMAYRLILPQNNIDNLTDEELIKLLEVVEKLPMKDEKTSEEFTVTFETISIDGLKELSMSDSQRVQKENSQDIIIVTDKKIKSIEQSGSGINEIEKWTKKENTITIGATVLTIWYKRVNDNSQTKICDSADPSFIIGGGKDDRKYIIYYEQ